jgi:hypothetical protein
MIYNNAEVEPSPAELEELIRGHAKLHRELTDEDVLRSSGSLVEPAAGTTVRSRDGVRTVTDGPYAEAKEYLAGYYLVECSHERAMEIAERIPCGVSGGVEIRAIDDVITSAVVGGPAPS